MKIRLFYHVLAFILLSLTLTSPAHVQPSRGSIIGYPGNGNNNIKFLGKSVVVTSQSGPDETIIIRQRNLNAGFIFQGDEDSGSLSPTKTISNTSTFQYNNEYRLLASWRYGACRSVAAMGDTVLVGNGGVLEVIDFSNPAAPVKLGEVVTPGMIRDIVVSGSWVYVADGAGGLLVIDVHDPTSPQITWTWELPRDCDTQEVLSAKIGPDGFLYFLFNSGVSRVDISDPSSPTVLHRYGGAGKDIGFAVGNGYVYISGYSDIDPPQLTILDLSSGDAVFQSTGPLASDMEYNSGYIYAVNGYTSNCAIYDVSDPPNFSGACRHFTELANANALEISADTLFAVNSSGLSIYTITDPISPALISSLGFGSAYDISIANNRLYAACGEEGVVAVSVEDPADPIILGRYEVPGILRDVYADSARTLIAAGTAMRVLQQNETGEFIEIGRLDVGRTIRCIYGIGPAAYLGTQDGLFTVDLTTLSSPVIVDLLALGKISAIDGNDDNLFALGDALSILGISDPLHPITLNTLPGGTYLDAQNSLVATSNPVSAAVYDVSNIAMPEEIFSTSLFGGSGVALSGDFLVYNDAYGVYSRNLFTGESHCLACGWGGPSRFGVVAGGKGRAYFENFTRAAAGLYTSPDIGINDPSKDSYPDGVLSNIHGVPSYSSKLHVFKEVLYNADGEAGLLVYGAPACFFALKRSPDRYIDAFSQMPYDTLGGFKILCTSSKPERYKVDITSPDLLIQVNNGTFSYSVTETTTTVAPGDSLVLSPVVLSIPEVRVRLETTISCIVNPIQHPELSDTAVIHIAIDPPVATAFITSEAIINEGGCLIRWRVSDPAQIASFDILRSADRNESDQWEPVVVDLDPITKSYLDAEYPEATDLMYRIVANMVNGSKTLSKPLTLRVNRGELILYANYPNPFNPSTKIAFQLPKAGRVELAIYSAEGKLITILINRNMRQGYHTIEWNGSNNLGQSVGSGVYFCRLRMLNQERVQKMVLIK